MYGVILEGMKFDRKKSGLIKVAGDWCYPLQRLKADFLQIKEEAHRVGLKFYAGENRLRDLGDSLCCCGADDMDGWVSNHYNLAHIINGDKPTPTEGQKRAGSSVWGLHQETNIERMIEGLSFAEQMAYEYKANPHGIKRMFGKEE